MSTVRVPAESTKAAKILLAEDEELLRELETTILTQAGYEVVTASTAEELRTLVSECKDPIDLLLTDVMMPGVSGQELVHLARMRWPGVRVLYMSGYSNEEIRISEADAEFLQKPFTPSELMAKIQNTLAK
ncbi:MAG: response regulator [Acidobacteria bacterium]|nr:response regulator [Acidobacteriota bacterium]